MMKKIIIALLVALLFPLVISAKTEQVFHTASGITLQEKVLEFIKKFGYNEKQIYLMSEDELKMFNEANIETVKVSSYNILSLGTTYTLNTEYKTITTSVWYSSTGNYYQAYATAVYNTIPASLKRQSDYIFLSWTSGVTTGAFTKAGYFYTDQGMSYIFGEVTNGLIDLSNKIVVSSGTRYAKVAAFKILGNANTQGSVVSAIFSVGQKFTTEPQNVYVTNYEQYFTIAKVNPFSIVTINMINQNTYYFNNNSTLTAEMNRYYKKIN